jgi:DNA-binding CsgD family transcriptional regulator
VTAVDASGLTVVSWPVEPSGPQGAISPAALAALTPALRAIHALLLRGFTDQRIAALRGTSRSVVTKQVNALFKKLGVTSRRELVARSGR